MRRVEIDETELRRLCAEPGARCPSVAASLGVSLVTVRDRMKQYGIPPFPRGHPPALPTVDSETENEQRTAERIERAVVCLRDLTPPQITEEAFERCGELLDRYPDHRGLFVVAGTTYGPHLTSRQNVGGIVAKAHEPCVVIDLDLLPAPAANDIPAAWPHRR